VRDAHMPLGVRSKLSAAIQVQRVLMRASRLYAFGSTLRLHGRDREERISVFFRMAQGYVAKWRNGELRIWRWRKLQHAMRLRCARPPRVVRHAWRSGELEVGIAG
jgi:hypothetical protein